MINQTQSRHGNPQMMHHQTGFHGHSRPMNQHGYGGNPQMGRPNMQQGGGGGGIFGGNQAFDRNQQVIGYLTRIKNRVIQDLNEGGMTYRDHTNFNDKSDLSLLLEVYIKINKKTVGAFVKMDQRFPKTIPRIKLNQTFVHADIDRSNNEVRIENICTWDNNKKIPDLLKEVQKYFEISPPENSPELQKLISDIIKINKSISNLKNFNYPSFYHNLLNDQQLALANGDYNCLRNSQEYTAVKEQMLQVSSNLQEMKMEVLRLQEEVREMSEEKKDSIGGFKQKIEEFEKVKTNYNDMKMRYDADNIKKFLQDQINKLMYQQEKIKEQMIECDADSLNNLQDDYLRVTRNMTKYVTLMEKAFAY